MKEDSSPGERKRALIGKGVARIDAAGKVTGMAEYTQDLSIPGMLEAEFLTSPHACAKILSVDASAARSLDGVVAVLTGNDLSGLYGTVVKDRPILARDVVRYVGEPVAAVAATSRDVARRAVGLIKVEYEPLKPVLTPWEAIAPDAPLLHRDLMEYVYRTEDLVNLSGKKYHAKRNHLNKFLAENADGALPV